MYQSHIYIEARIQLAAVDSVFITESKNGKISINQDVLKKVFILAKALSCHIPSISDIEHIKANLTQTDECKKITGYSVKVAEGGTMNLLFHSRSKTIKIEEVRIEEDSGRLTHANGTTRMDFSCAGNPSIRIKTESSFELGEEVFLFLDELRRLTQYLHLDDNSCKDGAIRCNAYVSLSKYPNNPDYYVKLRNLNSFNFARKAVNHELTRQENMIINGEQVKSESRIWNEAKSCTEFFQNRQPFAPRFEHLTPPKTINLEKWQNESFDILNIELPKERRQRFKKQYEVSRLRAEFLCDYKDRADFFEEVVALGAQPLNTAHWMASELTRLLNKTGSSVSESKITPKNFAWIIKKLDTNEIHSASAKTLLRATFETGHNPEKLMKSLNISEMSNEKELLPFVQKVIFENQGLCKTLKNGEMPPLEFLTGLVMKETKGKAVPQVVKSLIKKELNISVIYMLTTGGAISAIRHEDGSITSGDSNVLKTLAEKVAPNIPVQTISAGQYLSEELEPYDWAQLISEIALRINAGIANGIVVTHGTYTLSYTAALLYWLFSDCEVPIVLTASSTLPYESSEAEQNLKLALETASKEKKGVFVVFGQKILSPLNLHLERPGSFCNWNLSTHHFIDNGPIATQLNSCGELDKEVLTRILVEASEKMFTCRLYPGFRSDIYNSIIKYSKVKSIFLEMYGIGSGNMSNSDFSLKPMLLAGKQHGIRFYCTSQQMINLDFSQYITAHGVWREGAVPMGYLTTESVIALYFACSIVSDNQTEFEELMETYATLYSDRKIGD